MTSNNSFLTSNSPQWLYNYTTTGVSYPRYSIRPSTGNLWINEDEPINLTPYIKFDRVEDDVDALCSHWAEQKDLLEQILKAMKDLEEYRKKETYLSADEEWL